MSVVWTIHYIKSKFFFYMFEDWLPHAMQSSGYRTQLWHLINYNNRKTTRVGIWETYGNKRCRCFHSENRPQRMILIIMWSLPSLHVKPLSLEQQIKEYILEEWWRLLCQRAPKAVVALHQSKSLGSSHHFVFNRVAQLLCSSFLLVAHFTGNPHFTPFHWLDTNTRKHFLPMLLICWHKSTTLMRLFTKSRLINEGHNDFAVQVEPY